MKIIIHRDELTPYEKATNFSIDYMCNSLMGLYKGNEHQVYNFNHICKMDNRWSGYEITEENNLITITFSK
jgi:hypothetical protein